MNTIVLLASLAGTPGVPVATLLADARWMAGCWRRETPRRIVEEQWMAPDAGLMLGASRTVAATDGALVEYEQTRIEAHGDTLTFTARPSRQAEASFHAIEVSDSSIVFENKNHDFPQRIGYRRVGADSLAAWIEGVRNGETRRVEFPYGRVACPGQP